MVPPESVTIRDGREPDAEALATFGRATFHATYAGAVPEEALEAFLPRVFGEERQRDELRDPACRFLLAELNGGLAGYLLLRDDAPPTVVLGHRPLLVARLYVAPEAQGCGIGTRLLDRARNDPYLSARYDVLWLTVWERNPRAIAVYQRWGFVDVDEISFDLAGVRQTDRVMVLPRGSSPA